MSGRLGNTSFKVVAYRRIFMGKSPHLHIRTTEKFGNYGDGVYDAGTPETIFNLFVLRHLVFGPHSEKKLCYCLYTVSYNSTYVNYTINAFENLKKNFGSQATSQATNLAKQIIFSGESRVKAKRTQPSKQKTSFFVSSKFFLSKM